MAEYIPPVSIPVEIVERECLRCGKTFDAEGRFNRICPKCTTKNLNLKPVPFKHNRRGYGVDRNG